MDEIGVIKILGEKKTTESVTKSPAFLFPAIWLHLAHSCPGLKYMYKAKYKTLRN